MSFCGNTIFCHVRVTQSSLRPLFCMRTQDPCDPPPALTIQVLLKGFVPPLLIRGHTAVLSCYLICRLNPVVVFPSKLSIAVSKSFFRRNPTQPNSAFTFLKASLNAEYKLLLFLLCIPCSDHFPLPFSKLLLFHLPLSFKDSFTVFLSRIQTQ